MAKDKPRFKWDDEKIQYLINNWNTKSLYKLAIEMRTIPETLSEKAKELGLPEYKSNRWTEEEETKLRELAPTTFYKEIAVLLNKSEIAITKKAIKMGIKLIMESDLMDMQLWNEEKEKYLLENYDKIGITELGETLNISYRRIVTKLKTLGIDWETRKWKDEEIQILREMASKCHYSEIAKVLNRSVGAISYKAFDLGIQTISEYRKFTEEEKSFIKNNWDTMSASAIARELKCSIGVLNRVVKELNLKKKGQQIKWDDKSLNSLRTLAKTKTTSELAKKFKTTIGAIRSIAYKNGIELIDSKKTWSIQQEKELIELSKTMTVNEIAATTNRPSHSIRSQAKRLGITLITNGTSSRSWTKTEYQQLKELLLQNHTTLEIAAIMNRTEDAIRVQIKKLELENPNKRNVWTDEELSNLRELAITLDIYQISEKLNRSINSIDDKARKLGIKLINSGRQSNWVGWTEDELKTLNELSSTHTALELTKVINRTVHSISAKAKELGLQLKKSDKRWTDAEKNKLIELAKTVNINELSLALNKTSGSIRTQANVLGISLISNNKNIWTENEIKQLKELIVNHSTIEIAEIMNRTEDAVYVKAKKLGLEIKSKSRRWTEDEEELLRDMWGINSLESIAKKLDRSVSSITNRSFKLQLGSVIANNYDGLTIQELCDLFDKTRNTISVDWVALGLKFTEKKISSRKSYSIVTIADLFEFLEQNQNIWDSRILEKNILGKEPEWLVDKRKKDRELTEANLDRITITKQQLIATRKYFLEITEQQNPDNITTTEEQELQQFVKKKVYNGKK